MEIMKKIIITVILFFAICLSTKSKDKVFDLKDTYYNCGERNFSVIFKSLDSNFKFNGDYKVVPDTVVSGFGSSRIETNLYRISLTEITNNCKIYIYNYKINEQTGEETFDTLQTLEIIKIENLQIPIIKQVGNKLVSNLEGSHRWYINNFLSGDFVETTNNEFTPTFSEFYQAVAYNSEFDCESIESNRINFTITSIEDEVKYSNLNKYNINENALTFFEIGEIKEINSIEVYNILGEKLDLNVKETSNLDNKLSLNFDKNLDYLPLGLYVVLVNDNYNIHRFSFIK